MRIIFFDLDCLRPDHLGCYGYNRPTSPTIDSIAREGMIFENYHCASSPCLPSRTAWSSGRFGIRNGVCSNHGEGAKFHIRTKSYVGPEPENEMFLRRLRAHGFYTAGFSNFADRHNALWFMYGWSEFHTPNLKGGDETAEEVNKSLLEWLKHNATRENLFLYINYWDIHRCYKMDESWAKQFEDFPVTQPFPDEDAIRKHQELKGPFTALGQFKDHKSPFALMPGAVRNRSDFEHLITGYDAAIAYTDYHVSLVLGELERQGALEDAVIIISGDHGDAFGEHGIYSDHVCADECIHRIPLVIRFPNLAPGNKKCRDLLYNVDFAPTLCDILGIPIPEDWDGESFKENLKGKPGLQREHLVWDHGLYTVQRAVRTKTHLMIKTYDNLGYAFEPVEMYHLEQDPYQTKNIRDENPGMVSRLKKTLDTWVEEQKSKAHFVSDPLEEVLKERGKI